MAALPFQIEFVFADRGFVIARQLSPAPFRLRPDTRLGACPISAMDMPRALTVEGAQRTDLFAFRLTRPADASRLKAGDVVELTHWSE